MPSDAFLSKFSMSLGARGLRAMGKMNVPVYKLTRGRLMNSVGDAPVLLLTTTGRRSGQQRTAPVCFLDTGQVVAVIGSNAGNQKAPAWALNLDANPDAEIQIKGSKRRVHARVTEGEERAELWRKMNEQYSGFDDYEANTSRPIKVFALEPR